jgi:hypothetical protein
MKFYFYFLLKIKYSSHNLIFYCIDYIFKIYYIKKLNINSVILIKFKNYQICFKDVFKNFF